MSSALRKLAFEPNGDLAAQAYLGFRNFVLTGLLQEKQIKLKLVKNSTLKADAALDAIERGFEAARKHRCTA